MSTVTNNEKIFHEVIASAPPGPHVERNMTENWEGELMIPVDILPTNLGGCHIILRSYTLKVCFPFFLRFATRSSPTQLKVAVWHKFMNQII